MQQYGGIYLLQIYSTCFGCPSYHRQEYIKLYLQRLVWVISRNSAMTFLQSGPSPNKATLEEGHCTDM